MGDAALAAPSEVAPAPVPPPGLPPPEPPAEPPLIPGPSMQWRPPPKPIELSINPWLRVLIPFLIFVGGFGAYQYHLDHPPIIVFDEAHYVKVARNYTNGNIIDPAWGEKDPRPHNFEHPPAGKWLIAAGIWLNGKPHNDWENQRYITQLCGHDNPECAQDARGWRLASTVVGASGLVAAYLLAMRLFNRFSAGVFAALLLFLDGMYFMHSRLALLDIFPAVFWIWAFAFAFSPYRRARWFSGIFFGIGLASKFPVLFLLPLFLLVHFIRTPAPKAPESSPFPSATPTARLVQAWLVSRPWVKRVGLALLVGLVVPFVSYVAVYVPYLIEWSHRGGLPFAAKEFVSVHLMALTWDFTNTATHPFESKPWSWIPMFRPVFYYTFDYPDGMIGKQWSVGNPVLWWSGTGAAIVVLFRLVWRFFTEKSRYYLRFDFLDHIVYYPFSISRDIALLIGSLLFFAAFLPWFLLQRMMFIFYMTFVVPSFAIIAAGLLSENWDRGGFHRLLTVLYGILALAMFGLYYPIVTGEPITRSHYETIRSVIPWIGIDMDVVSRVRDFFSKYF